MTLNRIILPFLCLLVPLSLAAQPEPDFRFLTFENGVVPSGLSAGNGSLSISGKHFREGSASLCWEFGGSSYLSYKSPIPFEAKDPEGKDTYLSSFVVWVYNELPFAGKSLRFEFLKQGKVCSWFDMGAGFTGWRGAWVSFERDMQGSPEEGMDEFRVIPPSESGTIYLDHIITSAKIDSRYHAPDVQLPFVNEATTNHWLLIYKHSLMKPDISPEPLTSALLSDIRSVEKRFGELLYDPKPFDESRMEKIRKAFAFYEIRHSGAYVLGKPVFMVRQSEAYERFMPHWRKKMFVEQGTELGQFFDVMKKVAVGYCDAPREEWRKELREMFLDMYRFITDQGVTGGSAWGYCHHYGYNIRGMYPSYFLMKDVLREEGLLDGAQETLLWYAITNEVLPKPASDGIVIDSFNTHMEGRMASILLMEDTPEKVMYLRSFSRWLDYGCRPAPGLAGSFKKDGACFHHRNNYPAYTVGGLEGACRAIWCLSGTDFKISPLSSSTVRNVLLTMRFHSNLLQWPLNMSGRHPNGSGEVCTVPFALMALSGTPDGSKDFDDEMAAAFLRLEKGVVKRTPLEKRLYRDFLSRGIKPEGDPQGNKVLGYGCTSIHRRDDWMALVRGHSRYLWASEQYLNANFYGRYLGFGGMEIMASADSSPATLESSGWQENGFDWNRIPGVTSVHLPFESLRANVLNVDTFSGYEEMLYSDEAFAGGLSFFGTDGNFGMKVHGHDKYDGSFRARKSYHFADDVIVCLGSDIEDADTSCHTETTVFQMTAQDTAARQHYAGYSSRDKYFLDMNGTGYYVPSRFRKSLRYLQAYPQKSVFERREGQSEGDWVTLYFDHGAAPVSASYEYAVVPLAGDKRMESFSRRPEYKVLSHNRSRHIVHFPKRSLTSYVLFEKAEKLSAGVLQSADTSCLVMSEVRDDVLRLSVSQPDLALYRGPSDELIKDGKRVERSIYSRPWIDNESQEIPLSLVLKGRWIAVEKPESCSVTLSGNSTEIHILCKDAASYNIKLKKK